MTDNHSDRETRSERLVYEIDADERPSEAIVSAIATLTDTAILELDPLYHVIDPEQVDKLIDGQKGDDATEARSVSFQYDGCQVTVTQTTVRVQIDRE